MATLGGRTARTFLADYRDFARFLGADGPGAVIESFIGLGLGAGNACALAYRVHLADRQLAAGTVARRLVALRSACQAARRVGRITWGLDLPGPRPEPYRDTRGPGVDGWRTMLAATRSGAETPKGRRDLALLRCLHDLALRRAEAVRLEMADVDLIAGTVAVIGKCKTSAVRLTLPRPIRAVLADWLDAHPDPRADAPLFVGLDAGGRQTSGRLTGESVRRIIAALGRRAGLARVPRPHGLRHQAFTAALDSGRDIRDVRKFSRHAKLKTVLIYDNNRTDVAGEIARAVAGED